MVCSVRRKLVLFLTLFIFSFTFSEGKAPKPFTVDKTEGANYKHLDRHKCPDSCSHHGVCINNGSNSYCQCDDGWGGVACADVRYDLAPDEPISITIRKGQTVYCNITTRDPPFNNLTVYLQSFSKLSSIATPALYVGRDYYPDQDKNEYNDTSTNRQKSLTVLNPTFGNWYIALTSRDSSPLVLTIQINMDDVCFSNCSSNGKCQPPDDQGYVKCLCNYGHQGEYCEEYLPVMRNATPYTGYVDEGFWNYWHFNITVEPKRGMFLLLSVGGMDEQELPELYTQINGRPTASQYVCHRPNVSSSTGLTERVSVSNLTCIVNDISMLGKGNAWYIGVLGTKMSEESISNYTVSASLHLSEASQSLPSPLPSSPPRLLEKNIINRKWKQRSVL